jgi:hypothetical protein
MKWHKEYPPIALLTVGISLVLSILCWAGIHFSNSERAMFKEIWNYKINRVEFYERWDEEVPCNHPIYITVTHTTTDSKGNTTTYTEQVLVGYEHPYDVDEHPPIWYAVDEYGDNHGIVEREYSKWKYIWGNSTLQDMNRDYHSIDGDMYYSSWNNEFNTIYPWEETKNYKNKIRVAKSVFNFAEVSPEIALKYKRPADSRNGKPILSFGIEVSAEDELLFRRINALFGKQYRIHNIIILFDSSQYPISEIENIKNAWKGANKNELITCIAISPKNNEILWCDVFSWMDDTTLHSLIRQDVMGTETGTYSGSKLADILQKRIPENWKKKDFRDFDYLKVEIPFSYIMWGMGILVVLDIILLIAATMYYNENF